jgi:DNA topoisomerase II
MTSVKDFKSYTDIEHVRERPDMYIGSIKCCKETRWIIQNKPETTVQGSVGDNPYDLEAVQMEVDSNPGLEQCVLEILTNAADHVQRCKTLIEHDSEETPAIDDYGNDISPVTKIKISLEKDHIVVHNNGTGIPIEIKEVKDDKGKSTKMYVPEMIFGYLRTSSNYDDSQKKTWGGRNGIGAKAANIFSTKFIIELQTNGKKYYQEFTDGMKTKTVPKITKASSKGDYTKITYYPDFKSFGMTDFDSNETARLIKKRAYDLSAATGKETTIWINEQKIPVKDFTDYMALFIGNSKKVVYKTKRWEVGFALCPYDQATQISFVNAICTEEGGSHVTHVLDPVLTKITNELQSKAKGVTIKKQYIKDNVIIFIKALIENPSFSSQLKRKLETKVGDFGSRCDVPDDIIKKVTKLGICDNVMDIAKAKEMKDAMKKIDGTKNVRLSDIKKLEDANWAGTKKAMECTLILTEGDSAKGLALNGITSAGGRNKWGVFPLRGKFLNVRCATAAQLIKNEEIIAINRIMGLKIGLTDIRKLRYGRVMVMSDQDTDGYHIKGLLINYFTFNWPELVEQGLLECMMTPIVKVFKGKTTLKQFYNLDDYKKWLETNKEKVRTKYYKGLGTSNAAEAKEYFADLKSNRIKYSFKEDRDIPIIARTFDKDQADQRKEWIKEALRNKKDIDYNKKTVQVDYFINRELVQFSIYDNIRSVPNVIDGLKPSQRKILFACLKKKLFIKSDGDGEIKVSQLSGYIAEQTEYHHGEDSLQGTIVGMAQEFVGSGNLNLLIPSGNFGTRLSGGKDAAASRYIFTALRPEVKILFNETDNQLLNYQEEDGTMIEPDFYAPIVPTLLLNGSTGIGTGWSTNIPCFKLEDIVHNIRLLMKDEDSVLKDMLPYYKGFKGRIVKESDNCWKSIGVIEYVDENTVEVTELPVGMWKEDFKEYLDKLLDEGLIKNVTVNDDDEKKNANDVCYQIEFEDTIEKGEVNQLISFFKLEKNINGSNMVAFDENKEIQKYNSVEDILWTFYKYRLGFYIKRHDFLKKTLEEQINKISEKLRFVLLVIDDQIVVFKKTKAQIAAELTRHKFQEHDYLLSMALYKFTKEEVDALKKDLDDLKEELRILNGKSAKDLWDEDLNKLTKIVSN